MCTVGDNVRLNSAEENSELETKKLSKMAQEHT